MLWINARAYLWRARSQLICFSVFLYREETVTTTTTGQTTKQSENANVFSYSAHVKRLQTFICGSFSLFVLCLPRITVVLGARVVMCKQTTDTAVLLLLRYFMQIIVLVAAFILIACLICVWLELSISNSIPDISQLWKNVNSMSLCVACALMFYKIMLLLLLMMHYFKNRNQSAPSLCIVLCAWASDAVAVRRTIKHFFTVGIFILFAMFQCVFARPVCRYSILCRHDEQREKKKS